MKSVLFLSVIVFSLLSCASKTAGHSTTTSTRNATYREKSISTATMNADIINAVNDYRKSKGLPPLHLLAIAASEALEHSKNMAAKKTSFGHGGFNQRAIAIANDLNGTSSTGENIAFGKMTARQVIEAWLKSPEHKANIEGAFNYTGVGVAKDSRAWCIIHKSL